MIKSFSFYNNRYQRPLVAKPNHCGLCLGILPQIYSTASNMNEEEVAVKQREAGNRETARLWRAWRTIHELVQDRGYVLSEAEVKITLEEFERQYMGDDGHIAYAPPCSRFYSP